MTDVKTCPRCGRRRSASMGCPNECKNARIFDEDTVASLNAYQVSGAMHPFTCGHDHPGSADLLATPEGWRCPITGVVEQDWFHSWMGDWSWEKMDPFGRTWDREKGKWK